jgi:hypothetical protein
MPGSQGVVGYAASESWPEVLLGHSERQHHRREGARITPNRSRCPRAQSTQRRVVLTRPWTGGVGNLGNLPMAIQDGPRLGVLRPQINPVIGEHSHRVGHRLNNTRPDGSTCGGQLSTAAVQPSLH